MMKSIPFYLCIIGLLTFYSCENNPDETDFINLLTNNEEKTWHLDSMTIDDFSNVFIDANECISDDKYLFKASKDLYYDNNNTELKRVLAFMVCSDSLIVESCKWDILEKNKIIIREDTFEIDKITNTELILKKHTIDLPHSSGGTIPLYNYKYFVAR